MSYYAVVKNFASNIPVLCGESWGLLWEGRISTTVDGAREQGDAYEITTNP